jgi:integrase
LVKKINRLTARTVATLTKPGRHADGGGLYLKIDKGGAKRWTFMFERAGKQREAGLGSANAVSLGKARDLAIAFRAALADGDDPIKARQAGRAAQEGRKTFGQVAESFLEAKAHGWRNAKHRAQWRMTLETYAASMWRLPVDLIDVAAVLECLRPVWQSKPETASRLRGRIESVLDAARVQGLRPGENPARWKGNLDHVLPPPRKLARGHHAAMGYKDVPTFMKRLSGHDSVAAMALRFLILTAGRTGEVLGAAWQEIDLDAKLWTVPAARMKGGREHRVPLYGQALKIIEKLAEVRTGEFVFPGQKAGKLLSSMALEMVMRRMKIEGATVHGFRSSFRDWAGDQTSFPREVIEAALAHAIGDKTEAAYRRSDALEKRRKLMDAWAAFLTDDSDNVLKLKRA